MSNDRYIDEINELFDRANQLEQDRSSSAQLTYSSPPIAIHTGKKMKTLYAAIAATQKELGYLITPDKEGHHAAFSTLPHVLTTVLPVAQKNGLAIVQATDIFNDAPVLRTTVVHLESCESEEWRSPLIADGPGPQGLGKAETYVRRRTLMDIFGLATEGDPDEGRSTHAHSQSGAPEATSRNSTASNKGIAGKEIRFGKKFKGRRYADVPLHELVSYSEWAQKNSDGPLSSYAKEFIEDVRLLQLEDGFGAELMETFKD